MPTVTPWSEPTPPSREALNALLAGESLEPHWWANAPGDRYAAHEHPYHKVLYCSEGSISFLIGDGQRVLTLNPGDRLDLPPGTRHAAIVGPDGVRCVEGWRGAARS